MPSDQDRPTGPVPKSGGRGAKPNDPGHEAEPAWGAKLPGGDEPTDAIRIIGADEAPPLRFGPEDTGPLPHWTEPPTGEVPRILLEDAGGEDLDAWSSFAGQQPVWRDDRAETYVDGDLDFAPLAEGTRLGALDERPRPSADDFFPEDEDFEVDEPKTEPAARVTPIRTRGAASARSTGSTAAVGARAAGARRRSPAAADGEAGFTTTKGTGGRDMPFAIGVGVGLAVVAVVLFFLGPAATMVLVVAALFLSAMEFYEKLREKGYQPATLVGLVAVVGLPLAVYWKGEGAIALIVFLGVLATCVYFLLSGSADSSPLPNIAVTSLGLVLIGVMGSFAAVQLKATDGVSLLLLTAIGVVAYDVGGLFVGSAAGRTQLVPWVSPNKTVEGLAGGVVAVFLALLVAKLVGIQEVFSESLGRMLLLALVISVTAPLGDLTLSMLKRNLGVKDWGTLLPGHGGVLDRFCSFLFALPAVWYLYLVIVAP